MSHRPLAVLGALTLTVGLLAGCGGESAKESAITPQPVSRQTLADILSVNGELRREKTQTINAPTDGRVSEMNVDDGQEVNVGDVPFALDGRAAVAVPGDFSFFRTLDVGSDGPDVLQLERILAADGFSPGRVDRTYTEQTRSALARWQNKYGYGGAKPETDETVQIAITGNSAGYRTGRRGSAVATILSTASSVSTDPSTRVGPIAPARRGRVQASLAAFRRVGTPEKPIIEIATSTPIVQENPGGDTACWTVNADVAPSRNTVIPLQIQGDAGGADSARDGDYKTLEGDVTILAGQTSQQFCTEIFDDRIVEEDEEITVVLQVQFGNDPNFVVGPTDRATVTIEDDDTGTPVITISADSAKVNEGQGATFRLTSTLELNRGLDIFVNLGGSMTVEDDYRPLPEDYVTLGAGQTETTFTITPRTDDDVEPDEILTATIVPDPDINPQPYQIGSPAQASITVESGDVPELNISGGGSVREGGTTTFTITANQPMVEDTTINFQVGGSATPGQDYQVLSGIVIMRAGTSSVTIPMRTFSDDVIFYPSDMIVANWPARVGTVAVDAGEFVLQGSPVLDLTEPAISVKLKLSGTERAKVELGMEAQIQLEAGGTQYPGIITSLDDSATVGSDKSEVYEGIVSATGDLPNVDGASVSIDITLAERKNVLAVPIAAVLKSGSGNFVRIVNDEGRLRRVEVELGLAQDEYVEITEGLKGDELVVVSVTSAGQ
ncbi:MAG: hypothetical protein RL531_887 [Actinomycetota bacterium]|jgi:hypothetical protein